MLRAPIEQVLLFTLSKFLDFSEILEENQRGNRNEQSPTGEIGKTGSRLNTPLLEPFLEPKRDSTANRTTAGAELGQDLAVVNAGLHIQQITRVKYSFGADRQPEARQLLGHLDA